jgi:hypothetical protein
MVKKIITFACLFIGVIIIVLIYGQSSKAKASVAIPDNSDTKEIKLVLEEAYNQIAVASLTYDVRGFSKVFVNTSDYPLNEQQRSSVKEVLGIDTKSNLGYLTAMQAKYIARGKSAALVKTAVEKALQEKRDLTQNELQDLIATSYGQLPPSTVYQNPDSKTELVYQSIDVKEDKAVVVYDDGAALQEAILVKINHHWFIASIKPIQIHF